MLGGRRFPTAAIAAGMISTAVALALLAPSAALAHRHRFHGFCRIDMQIAPHHITAGEPIVIFGRLHCPGGGESGQTVQLFQHLTSQPGFTYVESATTGTGGYYELSQAAGAVETNRAYFVLSGHTRSRTERVQVGAQVTLAGPAEGSQLLTGKPNEVTFTGAVKPADAGALVVLQRQDAENGQSWHRIGATTLTTEGTYTLPHVFIVPGDANIRVLVRSEDRNVPSPSNVIAYEISQAQNSALTIDASADPILIGQSVTLSGKLAGAAAGTPVQLLAHTRDGGHFTAIAEASTNAAGEYTMPAQTPLRSTFYEVKGGGRDLRGALRGRPRSDHRGTVGHQRAARPAAHRHRHGHARCGRTRRLPAGQGPLGPVPHDRDRLRRRDLDLCAGTQVLFRGHARAARVHPGRPRERGRGEPGLHGAGDAGAAAVAHTRTERQQQRTLRRPVLAAGA